MPAAKPPIEIETAAHPTLSVIWLHGLGADGNDFVPIIPELGLSNDTAIRFIFPNAPVIPVSINGGYRMPAWYDILTLDSNSRVVDEAGIIASRNLVRALITQENARGIPSERIVIAGFSQGGAIAYTTGLTHPQKLAGIIALSTYIPSATLIKTEFDAANQNTPIFAAHGRQDDVVSLSMGESARDTVQALGCSITWHTYHMAHSVNLEEIKAIGKWLVERVNEKK